ncbi:hypothetical protein [Shimia marina]|nr:hypothetical protein [Shimia marina]
MVKTSTFFPLTIALFLSACGGTMHGVVRGEGTPVAFSYKQGLDRDTYTAVMNGETFTGEAIYPDNNANYDLGVNPNPGINDDDFAMRISGPVPATLFGNKGSTMQCNMLYADSSGFTTAGGKGVCLHSAGKIIDVLW